MTATTGSALLSWVSSLLLVWGLLLSLRLWAISRRRSCKSSPALAAGPSLPCSFHGSNCNHQPASATPIHLNGLAPGPDGLLCPRTLEG